MVKYLLGSRGKRFDPVDPMIQFDPNFYFASANAAVEIFFIDNS